MSAVYIVARKTENLDAFENHGIMLLVHLDTISAIGEEFGLKRLDECVYISDEDLLDYLTEAGVPPDDIAKANPPLWMPATEGFELVSAYIDKLKTYHTINDVTRVSVLQELNGFRQILEALAGSNDAWHFEYDI